MNYGTSAYGSTAIGGNAASQWFIFFPYQVRDDGSYEAEAEFASLDALFSLFLRTASDAVEVTVEAFSRNDPGETPQSQGSFGGFSLFSQHIIGGARFIKVRATVGGEGQLFEIKGRAGD